MNKMLLIAVLMLVPCYSEAQSTTLTVGPSEVAQEETSDIQFTEAKKGTFHSSFLKAIASARKSGKITRKQALKLRVHLLSPALRKHFKSVILTQMAVSGDETEFVEFGPDGKVIETSVDWDGLLRFLEAFIPILEQLIQIFGAA